MLYRDKIKLPSASKVVSAMNMADDEDPTKRDTRELMKILQLIVAYSPRLNGHLLTRRVGAATYPFAITATDKKYEKASAEAESRCRNVIKALIMKHEQTPAYGVMLAELAWENQNNEFRPKIVKIYSPVEIERYDDISIAVWNNGKKQKPIEKYSNENYIVEIDENVMRGGFLRSIIFDELLRHLTLEDWASLNTRLKGVIAGLVKLDELQRLNLNDEQIQSQITALDSALKSAGDNNYLRALSAIDIQFKKLAEGTSASSFKEFKAALEADIAIAVLGQANTSELPNQGGSRAALEVLNLIRGDILYYDIIRIESMINSQLLLFDYKLNYKSNANEAPWKFKFIFDENVDIEANARMFESASQFGIDVIKSQLYNKLGLSIPTQEDEVVKLQSKYL